MPPEIVQPVELDVNTSPLYDTLFVKVSDPAKVANVPETGRVTVDPPDAPAIDTLLLPENVIVAVGIVKVPVVVEIVKPLIVLLVKA